MGIEPITPCLQGTVASLGTFGPILAVGAGFEPAGELLRLFLSREV